MVRRSLIASLVLLPALAHADARAVLERAARFYAPPSPAPAFIRVAWMGTHDLDGADQARRPDLRAPSRAQHLAVIDPEGHRAALDTQQVGADGAPGIWRHQALGEAGSSTNRKSGRSFARNGDAALQLYRSIAWRLPRLAIAEMAAAPQRIQKVEQRREGGRAIDVLTFEAFPGASVEVFVEASGEVSGYAYVAERMRGPTRIETRFKPAVTAPKLGRVPGGFTVRAGEVVALDLDLLDARATPPGDEAWFAPTPSAPPASSITAQPARVEALFPGGWMLRNIGGYNSFLVDLGSCLAVFDAAATYGGSDLVPGPPPARPLSEEILATARATVPGKSVCWVVPSHHHDDHFGGIVGLARAGASVLTSRSNAALARAMLAGVPGARVEVLDKVRVFSGGPSRMEIREIDGGLHADELLFAWFPERRVALTADVTDYLGEEKRFLQLVEAEGLDVGTIYSVHSSGTTNLDELRADLDFIN